jgi:hypothetical protein
VSTTTKKTSSKTSKTLSPADAIEAKEEALLADAERIQDDIEKAQTAAEDAESAQYEAEAVVSSMKSAFARGDASTTAQEYAAALAGMERAELLAKGCKSQADRLARTAPNFSKRLANIVAPVIARCLPGVECVGTMVEPDAPSDTDGLPFVAVVERESKVNRNGALSGVVEVLYFRTDIHRQVESRAVETAFADAGFGLSSVAGGGSVSRGPVRIDRLRLVVAHAFEATPTVSGEPTEADAKRVGVGLAARFIQEAPLDASIGSALRAEQDGVSGKGLHAKVSEANVESLGKEDGVRRHALTVGCEWNSTRYALDWPFEPQEQAQMLRRIEDEYLGMFLPGVGVVEDVKPYAPDTRHGRSFGLRLTVAARDA